MAAESTAAAPARKSKLGVVIVSGVVLIAIAGGAIAAMQGAFKSREKVAVLTWNQDPFWQPIEMGAKDAAKDFGVDLAFVESKPDQASQDAHIKELIDSGIQGLALSPNNPKAQEALINDAAGRAVVITFDSDAPNTKRRGFVGTNDYAAGQIAAEQVKGAIPDGGKVIISVGSVEMSNGRDRRQGLIDDLMDRPGVHSNQNDPIDATLKGSKYEIVATVVDGGDAAKSQQGLADAIAKHPDVNCIVGLFSYSGAQIAKAIDAARMSGKIKVVGFDESADEQALVTSGAIYSSVLQDQYRCGYETVRALADLIRGVGQNGKAGARLTELPVLVMTPDNITALRQDRVIRTP